MAGDLDGDGDFDLVVAGHDGTAARILRNDGRGGFDEPVSSPTLDAGGDPSLPGLGDFDNDGDLDLIIAKWGAAASLYENDGRGGFTRVFDPALGGSVENASTIALADYDLDGRLDVYIGNWPYPSGPEEENVLLHNTTPTRNGWLRVHLVGAPPNTAAIGARVTVEARIGGASRALVRQVSSATTWRSMDDLTQHFGLGDASGIEAIEIRWPGGRVERFAVDRIDRTVTLTEGAGSAAD